MDVVLPGKRAGLPDSPVAFQTEFGWVLAGSTGPGPPTHHVTHHASLLTGDDILHKFWEIEEKPMTDEVLSPEERSLMQFFKSCHSRSAFGEFHHPTSQKTRS